MDPNFPRHRRHAGTGLQRRRNHLMLLRRAPASPSLDRCDNLDTSSIRHVTIPMNNHMTHTLTRSTRRPLTDGYEYPDTQVKFSVQLAEAFAKAEPLAPPMSAKTLRNNPEFRELWRRRKPPEIIGPS